MGNFWDEYSLTIYDNIYFIVWNINNCEWKNTCSLININSKFDKVPQVGTEPMWLLFDLGDDEKRTR